MRSRRSLVFSSLVTQAYVYKTFPIVQNGEIQLDRALQCATEALDNGNVERNNGKKILARVMITEILQQQEDGEVDLMEHVEAIHQLQLNNQEISAMYQTAGYMFLMFY